MKPSNSTLAGAGIGVPAATILSWFLNQFLAEPVPGPVEAAFGAVIAALVGYFFLGGKRVDTEDLPPTDGQAKSPWGVGLVLILIVTAMALAGCSNTRLFYAHAKTPPQYAKAVLEHHNAIGLQVADLVNDPQVSEQTRGKLRGGYRLTVCDARERSSGTPTGSCRNGPSYDLDAAILAYEKVRDAKTEQEMTDAVAALVPLITDLVNAIAGVKK